MKTPEQAFTLLLLSLCMGLWLAKNMALSTAIAFYLFVLFLGLFVILHYYYIPLKIYNQKYIVGAFAAILCVLTGMNLYVQEQLPLKADYFDKRKHAFLLLKLKDDPVAQKYGYRFTAHVMAGLDRSGKGTLSSGSILVSLKTKDKSLALHYGDVILVPANYQTIEAPYNPGTFDFKSWWANRQIYHQLFISKAKMKHIAKDQGNRLMALALQIRTYQLKKYQRLLKNPEVYAIVSTLVLGNRASLSPDLYDIYAKTGVVHVLSVSGAHVAILFLILNYSLAFLNNNQKLRVLKLLIIILALWIYAFCTGLSASALRATLMFNVFMINRIIFRRINNFQVLALCAFLQLLIMPQSLYQIGFQLSYVAVWGILYLQPILYGLWFFRSKIISAFWQVTSLSLAAQLATLPLSLYYFHRFPLYFILGNLLITLPLIIIMYLALLLLFPVFSFLAPALSILILYMHRALLYLSHLPGASLPVWTLDSLGLIILSIAMLLLFRAFRHRIKWCLYAGILGLITLQTLYVYRYSKQGDVKNILFYNVPNHAAVAFICGYRAYILTDLNIGDPLFQNQVLPALFQNNIVDYKVLNMNSDFVSPDLIIRNHQILFYRYKILLLDKHMQIYPIRDIKYRHIIWISDNPNLDFKNLALLKAQIVLIDNKNSEYFIQRFKAYEANNLQKHYILRKNMAYLIR